ncbi:hypothetical protein HZA56_02010, partial [Candidatus Poribacteria bacterium]|nr:hypothetical protein [Candidatus Poribacteria bacterium]
ASYSDTVSCGIYRYRVRACNSCGCGEWRTGSTDCNYTAPPAPASISYPTNDSDGVYTASWGSALRVARYELERSSDGGVTWTPIYSGPSASYSDTVSCGIYRYRVRACNNCGCSDWRTGPTECNYTTPPVPASITYPTSDSDGVYTVSWASALRVARYELERSSDGGVTWTPIYSGPNTSYNESVSCGVYRYRVNASNACGTSDWRPGVDCNYTSPPVPATLTYPASDADGQFTVSWATTSRATYYLLERSKDGGPWEPVYSGPSTSYGENIPCGSYRYRIRACNSCGCGAWRTGTTDCVVDGPPAPGGIAYPATDPDGEYIVSWGVSAAAASYRLERSGDAGSTWMQVYSGASTSFGEDVCPSPGNGAYRYRVRAIDANGCPSTYRTGTGNCVVTACEVCEPPDSPAAIAYPTGDSDGIYTVSWDASTSATSYQLERSKDGGSWAPVYSGADTFFDENVCSLNGHGDYAYRVRGINDCGSSDWRTGTWVCEACYACTKTLTAAETYAAPGAKCVVVLILIDNAGGVAGADLCLTFDPDIVTVSDDGSCQPPIRTTSLTAGFSVQYNTSTPGVVCISLARANAIQSGSGAFVEALFDVNEGVAQGGQSDIDFQNVLLYDESGNEIRPRACHEAGTLWIGCHGQKGDINNDGNINSGDAILALRIAAELCIGNPCEPADECERCRGDVNCDCDNNSGDAILILRYAAGLIQQFPCGMTCCGQYQ